MMVFKGLRDSVSKKSYAEKPTNDPNLLKVFQAESLLSIKKRREILKNIRNLVDLPTAEYDAQYLKAISNFAEFVQEVPETVSSYYSYVGGLLDHSLERAHVALSLCRGYFVSKGSKDPISPINQLWMYAVFTAALLLNVGKIALRQQILLCRPDGKPMKTWQPFTGSMVRQAEYYKYSFVKQTYEHLRPRITPVLARQILTDGFKPLDNGLATGFNWIATEKDVLEAWFAMLNQERTGGGRVLEIIRLAEEQALMAYFLEQKDVSVLDAEDIKEGDLEKTRGLTEKDATGRVLGEKADAGIEFLKWLKEGLESQQPNKQIQFNKPHAPVHVLPQGVFISDQLFEKFAKENRALGDWQSIKTRFNELDITLGGPAGEDAVRFILSYAGHLGGVVVPNSLLVFNPKVFPPETVTVSKDAVKASSDAPAPETPKVNLFAGPGKAGPSSGG